MLGYRMQAENIILVFLTLTLADLTSPRVLDYTGGTSSCHGLKSKHEFSNFSVGQIIPSDYHLEICVNNATTCCTQRMEQRLHTISQVNLRSIQTAKTDLIRKIFSTEAVVRFTDWFEAYLDQADMDSEFDLLYKHGKGNKNAYANSSYITKSFYDKLRKQFRYGQNKTYEIVDDFFKEVFKKMFLIFNGGDSTDVDMDCVASAYYQLQPFGNIPRENSHRLERTLAAARTMVYALRTGKSIVEKLSDDRWFSVKCLKSVTKMSQCSVCAGYSNLKPCAGHCIDVYTECLSSFTELNKMWDRYLDRLEYLCYQLSDYGKFHFFGATEELPYDTATAIANCRSALPKLIPKIMKSCSKGKVTKQRSIISSESDFFLENNERVQRDFDTSRRPRNALDSLLDDYERYCSKLDKFWENLPKAMCDETVVANNASAYCWDGSKIVNNTVFVQQGKANQRSNNGQNDTTIISLINQLESTIRMIDAAASGKNVVVVKIPDSDWEFSGSGGESSGDVGSGSGSGSGDPGDENVVITLIKNELPTGELEAPSDDTDDNDVETNSVETSNEVLVVKPPVETVQGAASYLHISVLLLIITSLLVQLE